MSGLRANILRGNPKEFLDSWCRDNNIALLPRNPPKLISCNVLHPDYTSCRSHILNHTPSWFLSLLPIYIPVHTLPVLLFRFNALRASPIPVLSRLFRSIVRSTCFMGSFPVIYWVAFSSLRNFLKKDWKYTFAIAGFISGNSIFIEKPSRRLELMMFLLPKAIESVWIIMKAHGWKSNPAVNPIMFSFSSAIMMTLYQHCPGAIRRTYYSPMRKLF
eukprot:279058_1